MRGRVGKTASDAMLQARWVCVRSARARAHSLTFCGHRGRFPRYANEDAFTDVKLGSNKISRGGSPLPYGFNCSKGWDPATGLGTPLFDKLLAAAMAL